MRVGFTLNGGPMTVETVPQRTLVDVLRDELGLTGTKVNCRLGECGACTVLLDGENVLSCLTLIPQVDGRSVETIEGLSRDGELDPVQRAFIDHHAFQCGYCTPGFVLMTNQLLDEHPDPDDDQIKHYLSGNLCRCATYPQVIDAVKLAARKRAQKT